MDPIALDSVLSISVRDIIDRIINMSHFKDGKGQIHVISVLLSCAMLLSYHIRPWEIICSFTESDLINAINIEFYLFLPNTWIIMLF